MATGKFKMYTDSNHLNSDKFAKRGGIYLAEGSHVVMALENGIKNPYPEPTRTIYYDTVNKKVVCCGEDVKWVHSY